MIANPSTFSFVILGSVFAGLIVGTLLSNATFMARFQTSARGNLITVITLLSGFALNQLSHNHPLRALGAFICFLSLTLGIRRKGKAPGSK